MPSDGPSKEELEYYYKNSRKYFDELANYYFKADPEYYEKFIAPFYSTFASVTTPGKPGSPRALFSVVIAGVLVMAAAGAVFFLLQTSRDTIDEHETEKIEKNSTKKTEPANIPADTSSAVENEKSYYQIGIEYYRKRDFENAEKYLKLVPKDDPNYNNSRRKLEDIQELKKEGSERDRYKKRTPIERIR
jgi:tetratricopeptide (TPR) repeat protein